MEKDPSLAPTEPPPLPTKGSGRLLFYLGLVLVAGIIAVALHFGWTDRFFAGDAGSPPTAARVAGPGPDVHDTEHQWIVRLTLEEIARFAAYAAKSELAYNQEALVSVKEQAVSDDEYRCHVKVQTPSGPAEWDLVVKPMIWTPAAYAGLAGEVLQRFGVKPDAAAAEGSDLISKLTKLEAPVLQGVNDRVSRRLEEHPLDAAAHCDAALLLGAFGMRENSGIYFDTREVSNRVTAHLALARALAPATAESTEAQLAELMLGLFCDTKQDCENRIDALARRAESEPALAPWVTAARLRNRRDYRLLKDPHHATLLERIEGFRAKMESAGVKLALADLPADEPRRVDWPRMILEGNFGVDEGHRCAAEAVPLELAELGAVLPVLSKIENGPGSNAEKLSRLVAALNTEPRAGVQAKAAPARIRVLDDGLWTQTTQRHLCHEITSHYHFVKDLWGVPEELPSLRKGYFEAFGKLTLFPTIGPIIQERDWVEPFKDRLVGLIASHPAAVAPRAWWNTRLVIGGECPRFDSFYSHPLPSGTSYCYVDRVQYIHALHEEKTPALEKRLARSPWMEVLAHYTVMSRYAQHPTAEQYKEGMARFLDYNIHPMLWLEYFAKGNVEETIEILKKQASIDPGTYVRLSQVLANEGREAEAAAAFEAAQQNPSVDVIMLSNNLRWYVMYEYEHGDKERALATAKFGAEVYSYGGLETMAELMERTGKLNDAEDYFEKIRERYRAEDPLIAFWLRQVTANPDSPFKDKLKPIYVSVFPNGFKKVKIEQMSGPPKLGVRVNQQTETLTEAAILQGDIIVALDGNRTETMRQYELIRAMSSSPEMDFIIYRQGKYFPLHVKLPGRRFNADFRDYKG